jgi:hypothetical protein
MARLEQQVRRYLEQERSFEQERQKLHAEIRRAAEAGMSHAAIADVLTERGMKISRAAVQRIASG